MAPPKKGQQIVIKRITVVAPSHHGGSWKVALADFMTALMCFFLVMWLISTSEKARKSVTDYFSTPSIIEYQFNNLGVELTLEKMFLDLINEPLKLFEQFVTPIDRTPNVMGMGMKKVVMQHLADQLGELAQNVQVDRDGFNFDIPDYRLFAPGTATPSAQYSAVMSKLQGITMGLEDSTIHIESYLFNESVDDGSASTAKKVATERADVLGIPIEKTLEHPSVDVVKESFTKSYGRNTSGKKPSGLLRFRFIQKETTSDGKKTRPLEGNFSARGSNSDVYTDFVRRISDTKKEQQRRK